jgi:hypothetical protein
MRHPRRSWAPGAVGALGLLLASSCFYTFDNPVEKEPPGSVEGSIALQGAVGGQTAAGGQVTVQWTNGLQLSLNTSSKFLFQDLPDGTYAIEVNIPPAAGNDFPLELLRPDILLPNAGDETDSLNIGTLQVPASGTVGGTVSPPAAGIVVGAFVPAASAGQIGIFEGFQTTTDSQGTYSFQLPAGNHALAASNMNNNAVGPAMVISGSSQTVNLTLASATLDGQIDGSLVGSGYGASATNGNSLPWAGASYVAYGAGGLPVGSGQLFPTPDISPGTGSSFSINVPGGQLVSVTLIPTPQASTNPCDNFAPFVLPAVPVIEGFATTLGQVTWLNNAALGANGIGPCADGGSPPVTDGGSDGGTDAGPVPSGWLDAGQIAWQSDGGVIQQTAVFPLTSDGGGSVVAWIAGQTGQTDLWSETLQNGVGGVLALLSISGNISPGSLSGAPVGDGVLLSFSTTDSTGYIFVSPDNNPMGNVAAFATPDDLENQQITTFSGQLNGINGAFVLETLFADGGVACVFTADGTSFGSEFDFVPGAPDTPIEVETLIGTSCDVADLNGDAGFCLAGSGAANIDGGPPVYVGFISSISTASNTPTISNTQFLGTYPAEPIYVGITTLPNQVAVSVSAQSTQNANYWVLSDLSTAPGAPSSAPVGTDLLVTLDGQVLGLTSTLSSGNGTIGEFLPAGAQTPGLLDFVNGETTDILTAYVDPSSGDLVTAGVPDTSSNPYVGTITVLRLVLTPDGG